MQLTISAWWLIPLALPVLLLGEWLVRRVRTLSRFNIPVPVVGGLLFALLVFAIGRSGLLNLTLQTRVSAMWWTWLTTPEIEWWSAPSKLVYEPLVVAFFTCVGLNASWRVARKGSWQLLLFLGLATLLAIIQNGVGMTLAAAMGHSPLLGLLCGSVTMTGGHGTAIGFADTFEQAGFAGAGVVAAAAATFGLVAGSLMGGPLGGQLIRRFGLTPTPDEVASHASVETRGPTGIFGTVGHLRAIGPRLAVYVLLLLACMKVGAWVYYGLKQLNLTFPVYMGSMLTGIVVRNVVDRLNPADRAPSARTQLAIDTATVDRIALVLLWLFLTMAMMSLNLMELLKLAGPMLLILATQSVLMGVFACFVTFNVMGRDYTAAVMAGGHCGFGLGATPSAVANMEALTERFGPSPRAFLVVTIVGAFLIDFTNALTITGYLNLIK